MSSLRMRYTETLFTEKLIPQSQTTCMCTSWDQLGPVGTGGGGLHLHVYQLGPVGTGGGGLSLFLLQGRSVLHDYRGGLIAAWGFS